MILYSRRLLSFLLSCFFAPLRGQFICRVLDELAGRRPRHAGARVLLNGSKI